MKTSDRLRHRTTLLKTQKDAGAAAVSYAVKLLSYRDRSEAEIRRRLAEKGFPEEIIEAAVGRLKEAGFIDDRRLARALVRHATEVRHLGRAGVKASLARRDLSGEVVDEAMSLVTEAPAKAAALVCSRLQTMSGLRPETVRRRLWGLLLRRGFSPETIRQALILSGVKEEP